MTPGKAEAAEDDFPAKTVIVGSGGRMGGMLLHKASGAGLEVCGVDQPLADDALAIACRGAALLLICVPARHLESVILRVRAHMPSGCVLGDITSVKEQPMRQMERHWPGPVVGTHPLFGPNNAPGDDLPVALTAGRRAGEREIGMARNFFEAWGCRVFSCTPEEHDRAMAKIQNLNFITSVAYFAALAGQKELLPFLTPSFERRKAAAAKMLNEDADMFSGLVEANPHSHEAARQYGKLLNLAASGDIELLCRRAQWWWEQDKGESRGDAPGPLPLRS